MTTFKRMLSGYVMVLLALVVMAFAVTPAISGEYAALEGVKGAKAVFEYSQGSPKMSNVIFEAIRLAYVDESVVGLAEKPEFVIVFHGPAVKIISSSREGWSKEDAAEIDKFQATLRQLKKDGIGMEICLYAADVLGVDKATIMPEIDRVGNGFISVIGYQHQGYAVVRVP
jgi:intracellular sulfur oxidation DsrE/DsrF family protein